MEIVEPHYTDAERYYEAQKRVVELRKFYQHLTVYLLCNPIVAAVNLMTSPGYLWCLWSVMGWGVAIVLHGFKVFNYPPFFSKEWETRKIQELMEKEEESKKQIWK